jgi:AcrR family transcriptional regulator
LLERLVAYSREHGLSGASLRPLAKAVGSSPRVLLYFFDSKENLIREVVAQLRREQLELMRANLDSVTALWNWLTDSSHADVERLFFESYALSLRPDPAGFEGFGKASIDEWLPPLTRATGGDPISATLVLAALRGLLLDRLATGDAARTEQAFQLLLRRLTDD